MGLKKRSKVSAEFSMSSLTDIIFLLLIFFMLTSSLVVPNALNLRLPGKSSKNTPPPTTQPNIVKIDRSGTYTFNGSPISLSGVFKKVREIKKSNPKANIIIAPHEKAPNEKVVAILDVAYQFHLEATITDPK